MSTGIKPYTDLGVSFHTPTDAPVSLIHSYTREPSPSVWGALRCLRRRLLHYGNAARSPSQCFGPERPPGLRPHLSFHYVHTYCMKYVHYLLTPTSHHHDRTSWITLVAEDSCSIGVIFLRELSRHVLQSDFFAPSNNFVLISYFSKVIRAEFLISSCKLENTCFIAPMGTCFKIPL